MIRINLLPKKTSKKMGVVQHLTLSGALLGLTVIVIAYLWMGLNSQISDLKKQIADFEYELGIKEREEKLAEQDRQIANLPLLSHLPAGVRKALRQLRITHVREIKHLSLE